MNCQTLLKRTFVGVVILGVIYGGTPYVICAARGGNCSDQGAAAQNHIREYAALVLAAIARFSGDNGPTPPEASP